MHHDATPEELRRLWNADPGRVNRWDELGLDEIVAFAQKIEREVCRRDAALKPIAGAPRDGTRIVGWWAIPQGGATTFCSSPEVVYWNTRAKFWMDENGGPLDPPTHWTAVPEIIHG